MADTTQFTQRPPSPMDSTLAQPLIITGLIRELLKQHFSPDRNIEHPALRKLIWRESEDTSIFIESVHRWRPELSEKRPAIVVRRNAYSNQKIGLGDRQQGPAMDRYGNEHFATMWVGSHTLFCINGSGASAEYLGSEVQRELGQFAPVIRKTLNLHRFGAVEVGEVGQLEEAKTNWVVPVTIAYGFEERWLLIAEAPKLKHIALSTILDV